MRFARSALAMAEQTCFLHALCRTDLKAKEAIQAYADDGLPAIFDASSVATMRS